MFRSIALAALILLAVPFALSTVAAAEDGWCTGRPFRGKVDKINKKKLIVDNRMGDKLSFNRTGGTAVEGLEAAESSWEDLKKGQWVTVCWKMMDKPRKAYKIRLEPTPEDQGDDA